MAVVGVYMDWDGDGFDTGTHDPVTAYVMSWSISRGSGPQITGSANPGSCTLILRNTDDRFNPYNAGGDLYGKLTDGVPVWIGVTDDGKVSGSTANGLFGGRITDITVIPSPGASEPSTVEIVCEDALGWYQRMDCRVYPAEGRAQDAFREQCLTLSAYDLQYPTEILHGETRYDLAHEIATMPISHADGSLGGVLDALNSATGTRHFIKPADTYTDWYKYTTRNRQHGLTGTATATLDAGSDHVTGSDGWRLSGDTVTNRQRASVAAISFTPATYQVWQQDPLPLTIRGDDGLWTRVVTFDDIVLDANTDTVTTGDTFNAAITPYGPSARLQLAVDPGDETVFTDLSIEGRLIRRAPEESYTANNFTSADVNARGFREGPEISGEYVGAMASAVGIAEHIVWRYGSPQLRPSLTVENWMPEMFQLDLYDTIAFTSSHLAMSARIFEIVGLTLTCELAAPTVQHHVATYQLQECKVQADPGWFVLDTSELDDTDILAY